MSKAAAAKVLDEPIAEPVNAPTIDERVASVLSSEDVELSTTLADLIAEVDDAIDHADQRGREARAVASNPKVVDHGALGRALDAEHTAHRLRNGMAALQQLHQEALTRERSDQWHREADAMEHIVLELRDELLPMTKRAEAAKLEYDLACKAIDDIAFDIFVYMRRCDAIEAAAPIGEARRLSRPISGLALSRFMKVPKVEPQAAPVVDYSIASRMWQNAGPVLNHEERIVADAERKANEELQMAQIYADRNAAASRIEQESQRRALASSQIQRDHENGF